MRFHFCWSVGLGLFLTACASGPAGPTMAQIASADQQMASENIPPTLRSLYRELLLGGERDYVWNAMRLGLAAGRLGEKAMAARMFDGAIRRVEALQEGAAQAERAKSKFVAESEKYFKGESYERAALYVYRGLLYAEAGDMENAGACFRRAQVQDLAESGEKSGDWYSAEWLLAYAQQRSGRLSEAQHALARAAQFGGRRGRVPPPLKEGNVLLMVEAGEGPQKFAGGDHGEKLYFSEGDIRARRIEVRMAGQPVALVPAAEDLYVQATTRGMRKVDHILAGKAQFKEATDIAGTAGIVAGAATAATSHSDTQSLVGLGLVVGGLISKGISGAAQPEADTRAWENLPHSLFFSTLNCPVGTTKVVIRALDASGAVVNETTREIVITDPNQPNQLWLTTP
jgi:tetratricopeptide (TPR) repeat protein